MMEFLGYTHVKPVKRQWEAMLRPAGQYRYNPPTGGSSNLEDSTYYLRFLIALPTLRLTLGDRPARPDTQRAALQGLVALAAALGVPGFLRAKYLES